jgi:hypothetical protein
MARKSKYEGMEGEVWGRWAIGGFSHRCNGHLFYECICECGNSKTISISSIVNGDSTSCGCYLREVRGKSSITHGKTETKEYNIWCTMKARCYNDKNGSFKDYGSRGISVCAEWLNSFQRFFDDMGECPEGLSIERIDNNGNYEPSNCRWATRQEQSLNRRSNVIMELDGKKQTESEWADELGISRNVLQHRRDRGWSDKDALTIPPQDKSHKWITFNGIRDTVTGWSKRIGGSTETLRQRLKHGWTVEKALTTPVGGTP